MLAETVSRSHKIPTMFMEQFLRSRNMDKDRRLINDPQSGVAVTEYKYDEYGNRTETMRFNKDRGDLLRSNLILLSIYE